MSASFTYDAGSVPLSRPSEVIGVFRYDDEGGTYELFDNILCLQISFKEGADPGSARFRYDFGSPPVSDSAPQRFEEVYPLDATGPSVVGNDDRIVVKRLRPDGTAEVIFDGFAQIPQADLDSNTESVTFTALGTPIREWDMPLGGALVRDADKAAVADEDIETDLPARFNPDGHPNASPGVLDADDKPQDGPTTKDSGDGDDRYPVFLGPIWPRNKVGTEVIRPWTLGMAARYIVARGNPDEEYTHYAALKQLDDILKAIKPKEEGGSIDRDNDQTYVLESIVVQDFEVTGDPWPVALDRLISPHGFAMRFALETDDDGDPSWRLSIYRKDDNVHVKTLQLQRAGEALDPAATNVGSLHLARDGHGIVNRYVVDSRAERIEASFVLAPGFAIDPADATTLHEFIEGDTDFTGTAVDAYREWIFDECGEGHWDFGTSATVTDWPSLDGALKRDPEAKDRTYAHRRRPGRRTLFSVDDEGKPYRAKLHVSKDYAGAQPGIWDGESGTWQEINDGGWELMQDRLGIRITAKDPNNFNGGQPTQGSPVAYDSGGKLSLVDWCAAPSTDFPHPRFRLTCVIEGDQGLGVTSKRRAASPTEFAITRRIDARDRFVLNIISKYSCLADDANIGPDGFDEAATDDTKEARSHSDGMRRAHELGVFAGSVTIPRFTAAYSVGDKIVGIDGRGVSLRSNAGSEQGETPIYPSVVAITWDLDGRQSTHLSLSDQRGEPAPERSESRLD
jgi:hypothetical protein